MIMGNPVVRNVTVPTITPFLPDPEKATGAAVLVAPGGAFMQLAMDHEGWGVARWLADRGIAAFVLKYRVQPTAEDGAEFMRQGQARIQEAAEAAISGAAPPVFEPAVADAHSALRALRERASEWNIDPDRIGMIGFSAGAMLTLELSRSEDAERRPTFSGMIYGPMSAASVPAGAPPLFAAIAADDPLFAISGFGLIESWRNAGSTAELHVYQAGGHGFGMVQTGTTAQLWPGQFFAWMESNGLLDNRAN